MSIIVGTHSGVPKRVRIVAKGCCIKPPSPRSESSAGPHLNLPQTTRSKRKRNQSGLDRRAILFCVDCHSVLLGGYKFGDYVQCNICGNTNFRVVGDWSPNRDASPDGGYDWKLWSNTWTNETTRNQSLWISKLGLRWWSNNTEQVYYNIILDRQSQSNIWEGGTLMFGKSLFTVYLYYNWLVDIKATGRIIDTSSTRLWEEMVLRMFSTVDHS